MQEARIRLAVERRFVRGGGLSAYVLSHRLFQTIIGLGFLVIVLFSPDGVIGLWQRWSARARHGGGRSGR